MSDALPPVPDEAKPKPPNLVETTWEEFAEAGLFWWINRALHLFGWALVRECLPDGKVLRVYPARCRYRGFPEETEIDGFRRLTAHIKKNVDVLAEQVEE